jgi:hypothetical protein
MSVLPPESDVRRTSGESKDLESSTLIVKPVASAEEQPHRLEEVTVMR